MSKPIKIKSVILSQKCSECNSLAAKIEIVDSNAYPQESVNWNSDNLSTYDQYRDFETDYLMYSGPGGSNGSIGDPINEERKSKLIAAFSEPFDPVAIGEQFYDMAGYCADCKKFYCSTHWNSSSSGYGKCPKGHGKSLDPHWSPDIA